MTSRKPIDEDDDLNVSNGRVSPSSGTDGKKLSYYKVRTTGGYEKNAEQLQAPAGEQKKTKKRSGSGSSFIQPLIDSIRRRMSGSNSNLREGEDEEGAQKDSKEKYIEDKQCYQLLISGSMSCVMNTNTRIASLIFWYIYRFEVNFGEEVLCTQLPIGVHTGTVGIHKRPEISHMHSEDAQPEPKIDQMIGFS
ncbi:uncharacterized protein FOMMEDRAFT_31953 [Fomitiporia mediterranea MF3/22]|uniref:uncharacterized protein n=1 Tax=Fomitiporia mediterranea (strain MF3/22) TaxID=694068 RepID=UPI0004409B9A|nr:uncharacterized protein FOMMEDRAFT_31953 [Fomitiporia mediterranea MF3/22]EJC98177.1 hypothetical protein FOMMEDRAFT_31953 [Fomitiporia mediterranea MF3/22]